MISVLHIVLPPILVPRQPEGGLTGNVHPPSLPTNNNRPITNTATTIEDFPSLDDLASSIADSPDFIMSTTEVNSPSPASMVGSESGGTFPLSETPPPGYMSEDGDTQEPADGMSK